MAYSDYGGYAYRDGVRVESRSDVALSEGGEMFATPGAWPGWTLFKDGKYKSGGQTFHALLGDGPVMVGMYKQCWPEILRGAEPVNLTDVTVIEGGEYIAEYEHAGKNHIRFDYERAIDDGARIKFKVDDTTIELVFENTDNFYCFAKLTQPDGTMWHGFSGYGVGAGLEDAGYGFSTEDCVSSLQSNFPGEVRD